MNIQELKGLISESGNEEWFLNKDIEIASLNNNFNQKFKGIISLFKFIESENESYANLLVPSGSELERSKNYFLNLKGSIENFVNNYRTLDQDSLDNYFSSYSNINQNIEYALLANSSEVKLILELTNINSDMGNAAFKYLTKTSSPSINSYDNLTGYFFAYEFKMRETRKLSDLVVNERQNINRLKNDLRNAIPRIESELELHLSETKNSVKEYITEVDDFKQNKEKLFEDWFINSKGSFENFEQSSNERLEDLEETYNQKLKLEEPAKYWDDRGKDLKKQGNWALFTMLFIVGLTIGSLAYILIHTPEQLYKSFFDEDKSAAIRWSIIYVSILSLIAFVIKQLSKVMFSSFHLARDCQERYTLTYFYLSLLKNSAIDPSHQQLIMQSLFSRAETGLLKDDSSPTMPSEVVSSILKK